jgi:tRNA(Ile)-lysidine synthase
MRNLRMAVPESIQAFFLRHRLGSDQKILVAVSGGVDSMVLLHALQAMKHPVIVAHVNHNKREASKEEAQFIKQWCLNKNIPLYQKVLNPQDLPKSTNFQDWARQQRYAFFEQVAARQHCTFIATAHHFDDKVETFVGHAIRGSGINGLSSLREKESNIIRPLLACTKAEVLLYAQDQELEWREDASNESDDYQRNRIRHHALPALDAVKGNWRPGMKNTFDQLNNEQALLLEFVEAWRSRHIRQKGDQLIIPLSALSGTSEPASLLFHLLSKLDNRFDWNALAGAVHNAVGSYYYGSSHRALRDRQYLIVEPIQHVDQEASLIQPDTQTVKNLLSLHQVRVDEYTSPQNGIANNQFRFSSRDGLFDFDKLTFPLTLRYWQEGDKFMPLGMKGMKRVSDYLTDAKVPRNEKERTLVLTSREDIIWLVGHRIDERFKVGDHTQIMYLAQLH